MVGIFTCLRPIASKIGKQVHLVETKSLETNQAGTGNIIMLRSDFKKTFKQRIMVTNLRQQGR